MSEMPAVGGDVGGRPVTSSPLNSTVPACGFTSPQIALEERRLAGAVGAEQGDDLALVRRRSRRRRGSAPGRRPRRRPGTRATASRSRRAALPCVTVGAVIGTLPPLPSEPVPRSPPAASCASGSAAAATCSSSRAPARTAVSSSGRSSPVTGAPSRLSATRLGTRIPRRLATPAGSGRGRRRRAGRGRRAAQEHEQEPGAGEEQPELAAGSARLEEPERSTPSRAPAIEPRPPMTAVANTSSAVVGWKRARAERLHESTWSPPAMPAITPATRKADSLTLVVGTAAASAARWLSRVAIDHPPGRASRTPMATRIDSPRNARQRRYIVVARSRGRSAPRGRAARRRRG